MSKMMNVIMGLALVALGILGITGWVPMFKTNEAYISIGEIVVGGLGLLVGVYARQNTENSRQSRDNAKQKKEIAAQRSEIAEQRKENYDQKKKENDQLRKDNADQLKENNNRRVKESK